MLTTTSDAALAATQYVPAMQNLDIVTFSKHLPRCDRPASRAHICPNDRKPGSFQYSLEVIRGKAYTSNFNTD